MMPDFFRGKGWKTDNVPPKEGRPAMQAYIQSIGSWEIVRPDLLSVVEQLKKEGKTSVGVCKPAWRRIETSADVEYRHTVFASVERNSPKLQQRENTSSKQSHWSTPRTCSLKMERSSLCLWRCFRVGAKITRS
jgi:hypothetical protein